MRILLTGGSGMVGRNVLDHERAAEHDIDAPTSATLDLRDPVATQRYIAELRPDVVIHSAGVVGGIQANIDNPVRFFTDNMVMGVNVIHGARSAGVPGLLNLGSSCMYPRDAVNPLREDVVLTGELEPTNEGYALAKIGAARLCQYISREDPRFRYRTVIPCNLYGRHDKFGAGAHMIPAAIAKVDAAVRSGGTEVEIWGTGEARREFMYAGDLAEFLFLALDKFDDLPDMINVGIGRDYSINDYYRTVADVLGYHGRFTHDLSKPVGMNQKLVDTTRLDRLGWAPSTSLEEGVAMTHTYYESVRP